MRYLTGQGNVNCGMHLLRQISVEHLFGRGNVRRGCDVGDVSGRGSVRRGCAWSGKCLSGKCLSGKSPSGKRQSGMCPGIINLYTKVLEIII